MAKLTSRRCQAWINKNNKKDWIPSKCTESVLNTLHVTKENQQSSMTKIILIGFLI